ncbi:hypothetical protein [Rhodococcus jostii]|uniref:hypothetical protein n=1 Tax=Rhodococcus jostii TaxID=132919 RepID=UPI003634A40B
MHFGEPLRGKLDALATRAGSDRAELMRLAAKRVLEQSGLIEQAVSGDLPQRDKQNATPGPACSPSGTTPQAEVELSAADTPQPQAN